MSKAKDFINKHNLSYTTINLREQMPQILKEMQDGLDGKESSLLMALSYLTLKDEVKLNTPVICVDAGGTNLRHTVAHFDNSGNFVTDKIHRCTMPGVKEAIKAEDFFMELAKFILPHCDVTKEIVLSFAYRATTLENLDCEIVGITKEVKVIGSKGKHVAKEICECLEKLGVRGCNIIVINDSVATALSGKAEHLKDGFGSFTGTILGTGSNSCYMEEIKNIGKYKGEKQGVMVINTEAGSYSTLPRSDIDIEFNEGMNDKTIGISEKMSSGGYLGALSCLVLNKAYEEGVFLITEFELEALTTLDVNEFLTRGSGVIEQQFTKDEDLESARELLLNLVKRAGNIVALQMAACAKKAYKTNNKICMTVEGTTYEKMYGLREQAEKVLLEYLYEEGLEAEIINVDTAVLKGCAIAGLSR